jgi:hypothetical protein
MRYQRQGSRINLPPQRQVYEMLATRQHCETSHESESRQREGLAVGRCIGVDRCRHDDQHNREQDHQRFEDREVGVNLVKRFRAWRSGDHSDQSHDNKDSSDRRRAHG